MQEKGKGLKAEERAQRDRIRRPRDEPQNHNDESGKVAQDEEPLTRLRRLAGVPATDGASRRQSEKYDRRDADRKGDAIDRRDDRLKSRSGPRHSRDDFGAVISKITEGRQNVGRQGRHYDRRGHRA